jgi:hypothetical protein
MSKFYSKSTGGFYCVEVHGTTIPSGAVEITDETHERLLVEHYRDGRDLVANEQGYPVTVPRVVSPEQLQADLKGAATHALKASDVVVLRCYEENEPVPQEWVTYRKQLREVVAGRLAEMPQAPPAV